MERLLQDLVADGYHLRWDQRGYEVYHGVVLVKEGGTDYEWGPGSDPLAASIKSDVHKQCAIWSAERHQRRRRDMAAGDNDAQLYSIGPDDYRTPVSHDTTVRRLRTPVSLAYRFREWLGELLKAA